jgi:acyl transferase domain-containing protein
VATEDRLREYLKRVTVDLAEARRRIGELEDGRHEPVAVIGMACRYPGGGTVEEYWDLLREGRTAVSEVPPERWDAEQWYNPDRRVPGAVYTRHGAFLPDVAGWDAQFFGVPPQEALRMDPHQRLLMELVWEGLENAGTSPARVAGSRTAVMVGLMDTMQFGLVQHERQGTGIVADPYFGQGVSTSVAAGRLAYQFDLHGPAVTLDTACSSSLVGVHLAAQALRRGECDLAVAAGVYLMLHPNVYVQACATSMLSPDGLCKTFDARADGYVMGEGGGVVVLERLSSALRNGHRIRAVLRGSAVNQDGMSNGLTAPNRGAQVDVIRQALTAAGAEPDQVGYVEAHGSGTALGDAIELSALHDVFGGRPPQRPLHVGAVKTNIGHTQSAAGIAGLIKAVLVLENGTVPPNLHTGQPSGAIPPDGTIRPATATVPLPGGDTPRIAGVSSFGWSGTNAHLVLEAAASAGADRDAAHGADPGRPAGPYVLPVSAADPAALRAQLERLGAWWDRRPDADPADVAHTLAVGRSQLDYRRALVCTDRPDAVRRLADAAAAADGAQRSKPRPRIAFLLPGVGDGYPGLGRELYRDEPVYAAAVDECLAVLDERCAVDLRPVLFPDGPSDGPAGDFARLLGRGAQPDPGQPQDPLLQAEVAHPFQFTVEYALAKLLGSLGVTPDLLVGYSLGEYVAGCLSGVFSLEDALCLVVERARLIAAAPAGRMLAVAADEDAVRAVLADGGAAADIAALNGPAMTVVSGAGPEIDALAADLAAAGIACRPLRTAHAFHSSLLEPARDKLAALLGPITRRATVIPIVSNLTGEALTERQATGAEHWADHLVSPVRFAQSVQYCAQQGVDVYLELGAGQTLGGLVRQNPPGPQGAGPRAAVVGTLPPLWTAGERPDARTEVLAACGRLWEAGVAVDWSARGRDRDRIVTLPGYPFHRTRFWPAATPEGGPVGPVGPSPRTPADPADLCYIPSWRRDAARTAPPPSLALPGPLVVFSEGGADGAGPALADLAAAAGTPVLEVVPGTGLLREGRRLTIDPAVPEHYREIRAALGAASGPVHLVHLWSLLGEVRTPPFADADELRGALRLGFDSLLRALQAFGEHAGDAGIRLLTVSSGAAEILGGDAAAPHRAAVHGLGRVARHEYAGLTWRGVDLDPRPEPGARRAGQLALELAALARSVPGGAEDTAPDDSDATEVSGWRTGRRWLQEWAPVPLGDAPAGTGDAADTGPGWRPDGVYLITGGTRGLGMALARHLVAAGVRNLALVGRSRIDRAAPDPGGRAAATLADVAALESAGARVLLLAADAGNPDELAAALDECRAHYGALHGVVHAAGVPASGLLQRMTPETAAPVLAPKVLAMAPLARLVGPETPAAQRPELLILYSSAITSFGGIGEGDYCAANSVLDAYGAALSDAAPSTRVLTVAWGPWQHDDWQGAGAGSALADRVRSYRARYGFPDESGCAFLGRIAGTGHGSALAVRQPMRDARREWSAVLDIDALVGSVGALPSGERFPRPQLRTEFVAARTAMERTVAAVWEAFLGIDGVGVHDPFFDLGGNSLVGLAMVRALEKELGAAIAPATLFEHPTVAEFAAALDDAGRGGQTVRTLMDSGTDRGAKRRGARAGQRR